MGCFEQRVAKDYLVPVSFILFSLFIICNIAVFKIHISTCTLKINIFVQGETNTWVLSPEELIFGEGTYYLMVSQDMGMDSTVYDGLAIAVTCFASRCVFWDEQQGNWNSYGCQVSRKK